MHCLSAARGLACWNATQHAKPQAAERRPLCPCRVYAEGKARAESIHMTLHDPFSPPPDQAIAVGTGRLTLDVIVRDGDPLSTRSQAGGTCGNVMANLACLGWQCHPLTDVGDDDPGERFLLDLENCGVRTGLIRRLANEPTPVIVHHINSTPQGAVHSFSSRCPFCAHRLRYYEPVPTASVRERLPAVPSPRAFFFDRDSEGAIELARHCRAQGAMVVFEPNYAGKETLFDEALAVADVLKFSRERLPGLMDRPLPGPSLIVETRGADGLRFLDRRSSSSDWLSMPSLPVPVVRDSGGAGDWTTAGFVHLAGANGREGYSRLTKEELWTAIRFGQALGAWNCAFEGARGGIYCTSRERWQDDVRRILAGELFDPFADASASRLPAAGSFCPGCRQAPR